MFTTLAGNDDNWHHYAFTFEKNDDNQLVSTLYVDGVYTQQLTDTARTVTTTVNSLSGNVGYAQGFYFTGSVDEFRYWNTHVDGGSNVTGTVELPLSLYLKFNEGITTVASTDSTVLD